MSNMDRNDGNRSSGGGRSSTETSSTARPSDPAGKPSTTTRGREFETAERAPKASKPVGAIIAALLAGLILGALAAPLLKGERDAGGDPFAGVIDSGRYQAVILSNDKVYFGKISDASDEFYELDSAFFLREVQVEGGEPDRALLPVNREIHAPDNTMLIRKEEVVLVENLAKDSPILTEINRQKG